MLCSVNKQDIMNFRNLIKTLTDEELYNFTEEDFDFYLLVEELFIEQEELQKKEYEEAMNNLTPYERAYVENVQEKINNDDYDNMFNLSACKCEKRMELLSQYFDTF
jgi:hypothetical protein